MNATSNSSASVSSQILYLTWADCISISGLICYAVVCHTILHHRKTTFSSSFFSLALSLAIPDIYRLSIQFLYVTPAAIFGLENMPLWYAYPLQFCHLVASGTILDMTLAICLNRLASVTLLQNYESFFTFKKLAIINLICYGHALAGATATWACYCINTISNTYTWKYVCTGSQQCQNFVLYYGQISNAILVPTTVIIYAAIFIRVRKLGRHVGDNDEFRARQLRREKVLVFQCGCICIVLVCYHGTFWFATLASGHIAVSYWVLGTASLLRSALNPFLLLIHGSEVKRLMFTKVTIVSNYTNRRLQDKQKSNEGQD